MEDIILKAPLKNYFAVGQNEMNCPECNDTLVPEESTILLYAKSDKDEGEFMTNISGSKFCKNCPIVVFDKSKLEEAANLGIRKGKNIEYSVIGIVNLEATKEAKLKSTEMETDIQNIPVTSSKIGRNESCPCGSRKKYKRCCLKKQKKT